MAAPGVKRRRAAAAAAAQKAVEEQAEKARLAAVEAPQKEKAPVAAKVEKVLRPKAVPFAKKSGLKKTKKSSSAEKK